MSDDIRDELAQVLIARQACCPNPAKARKDADTILARFLVVPRDQVTTEYGWRKYPAIPVIPSTPVGSEAESLERVRRLIARDGGTAWQRPALPWTPIPLPEGGDTDD